MKEEAPTFSGGYVTKRFKINMVDFVNLYNNPDTDRTTLTANLTIAASMSAIAVESTDLLQVGVNFFVSDGSEFIYGTVTAINSPTDFDADKISGSANSLVIDSGGVLFIVGPQGAGGGGSPLTTKGDLFTYDTGDQRLAVGLDGEFLIADSGEATGLTWGNSTIEVLDDGTPIDSATDIDFKGSGVTIANPFPGVVEVTIPGSSSPLTTKGDIYTYGNMDDRLPVGVDGQRLSANNATATGLEWVDGIIAETQNTGSPPVSTPVDGTIIVDENGTGTLYVRVSGVWRSVTLT